MGIFPNQIDSVFFYALFIFWLLFEIILVYIVPIIIKKEIKKEYRKYTYYLFLSALLPFLFAIFLAYISICLMIEPLPDYFFYIGIGFMLLGMIFRDWAAITMRKVFYSAYKNNILVREGPYGIVRHPAYGGSLLIILGITISLRSILPIVIIFPFTIIMLYFRAKKEEVLLEEEFGQEYVNYKKKVKRMLIPFIL